MNEISRIESNARRISVESTSNARRIGVNWADIGLITYKNKRN